MLPASGCRDLADSRAEYANLVAAVQNHTRLVEAARKNLADVRARQAAAHSASVITRVDGVEAGIRPLGPSRTTITAAGGVGGLLLGFGFIFLFASPPAAAIAAPVASSNATSRAVGTETKNVSVAAKTAAATAQGKEVNLTSEPANVSPPAVQTAFGMFRGMTLNEAVQAVERRGH